MSFNRQKTELLKIRLTILYHIIAALATNTKNDIQDQIDVGLALKGAAELEDQFALWIVDKNFPPLETIGSDKDISEVKYLIDCLAPLKIDFHAAAQGQLYEMGCTLAMLFRTTWPNQGVEDVLNTRKALHATELSDKQSSSPADFPEQQTQGDLAPANNDSDTITEAEFEREIARIHEEQRPCIEKHRECERKSKRLEKELARQDAEDEKGE